MEVQLEHVSVGCNRTPHCVDWNASGLLAYGADKSIALAVECRGGGGLGPVFATLHGHKERVNCVQWIRARTHPPASVERSWELVSGAVDCCLIVWQQRAADKFVASQVLSTHTGPVTCLAAIYLPPDHTTTDRKGEAPKINTLIASGSSDSSVIIWERRAGEDQFAPMQTVLLGRGFALGMDFCILTGTAEPVFACGGDDSRVGLFVRRDRLFVQVQSLTGHEDWVRDLQFAKEDGGDLLLASCSQDAYIRLWRIAPHHCHHPHHSTTGEGGDSGEEELRLTRNTFSVLIGQEGERQFTATLESVLIGHEDWVYSIQWQPLNKDTQPLTLLSASMDKTMIVWKPDPATGVWIEQVRVGEVGGNTLGLYGGVFSPRGNLILAHGYQGAFHLWKKAGMDDSSDLELWQPLPAPSGHFGPVQDLSWEPAGGKFLLSVSSDQTTRLHAPWKQEEGVTWHEVARPQIHGYDMQCVAMTTSLQYVSGADEKVLRIFEAPGNFIGNLSRIARLNLKQTAGTLPLGASVPSLGLSNKAVFSVDQPEEERKSTKTSTFAEHLPLFTPVDLQEPPVEDHLLQNTLWPETQKLYGHGYEIFCVASSTDGRYIASACKASKPEHASIRVWSTDTWRQVTLLTHHTLTVTQLAFSHSGTHLLAVSRDRGWSLWKHTNKENAPPFSLVASTDRSSHTHTRIIWSCGWAYDDFCFATASRDKKVYLWSQHDSVEGDTKDCGEGWSVTSTPLECSHAVTAVNFAPTTSPDKRHVLAVGLESGEIMLHTCQLTAPYWSTAVVVNPAICHTSAVKRLQWKPLDQGQEEGESSTPHFPAELMLASCSQDHAIRLFTVWWSSLSS